jgi:hypothetical protein
MTDLKLFNISKVKDDVYFSKAVNKDGGEITLQFKTECSLNLENKKAKLKIEDVSHFKEISEKILTITHDNSNNWFNKDIKLEDLKDIYKDALIEDQLHVFYNEDTIFYNKKETLTEENLSETIKGTVLLRLLGVVYTKTSFFCRWEIILFKLKEDKKEVEKINDYIIRYIEEDENPLPDLDLDVNLDKIFKNLTLF